MNNMGKDCNHLPIIIPSLDPDYRMIELIDDLHKAGINNIVICNDGSSEKYESFYEIAKEKYGCVIIKHENNMGKGRALKDSFLYCIENMDDLLGCITADSDGQHSVECILKCMESMKVHPQKLILGVRNFDEIGVPWKSRWGNMLTSKVCKYFCGINISDTQTGLRGIPAFFMKELLNVPGERFEFETQMLIETINRVEIEEVTIKTIYDSVDNHATHFNPVKDSIRIYKIFGKMFFKYIFSSMSSCVVDILLFILFEMIICRLFPQFRFYIAASTVMARLLSATYNYLLNHKFVFKSNKEHKTSLIKYASLAGVQMMCSALFTSILAISPRFTDVVAKIIVDTTLFFISYYLQRKYIF